ncbi:flavohemoglobin expression-modulating QEGLA motif protein [Aquimonas voraii]|uniref:Flavohemoglobin expression-modulating QEGLA motif protein n=1 Tax=Aquimonas voraii TaxID=265719 RepID=A0A1G6VE18_9GAMM|nr:flavohemoglobin expression-modulating QEGLA motif protein [Aquimonas voraii]SDD51267.1 conserved hypothetical protein [Aquimonas voraii]
MAPELAHHIALDARLVEAVGAIRLLQAVSWPVAEQERFLEGFRRGQPQLPTPRYRSRDLSAARAELAAIRDAADPQHPLGQYLQRSAESWLHAAWLIEAAGSEAASWHSIQIFGRPGDALPGSNHTNIDAARHFIEIADEVSGTLAPEDGDEVYSAEAMAAELQASLDAFFVGHRVRVEVDSELIAKAAAGPTRIRLRGGASFSEYDLRQLLEHEAFVHSLTALNGREQPHLKSLSRSAPRVTATQEGLATFAELMTGAIDLPRLKRLSLRILAIDMALNGADFIQVFRFFLDSGQSETESFASAQRVFRGCPTSGGAAFTKDAVYLHGMLSVHTFFRWTIRHRRPRLAHLLFAGKMALHDVFTLEPLFEQGVIAEPLYLPPWAQRANGLAGVLAFSLFANRIRIDRVEAEDLTLGL